MYEEDKLKAQKFFDKGYIINGPRLQRLTLRDLEVCLGANYFEFLLRPLPQLTHLDLSGANHRDGHGDFEFLLVLENLKSLVLHDVPGITQSALVTISKLKLLRYFLMFPVPILLHFTSILLLYESKNETNNQNLYFFK